MALRNLLNINVITLVFLSFFGCNTQNKKSGLKDKEPKIAIKKSDTSNFYIDTIDKGIDVAVIPHPTNDTTIVVENIETINESVKPEDKSIEGKQAKEGTEYVVYPKARINDSINLFVDNYDRLMRRLTKKGIGNAGKGIESPIERDSLLWEEWQKIILQNDSRHIHQPYKREYKWGNNK